jgi:hypothetical protein
MDAVDMGDHTLLDDTQTFGDPNYCSGPPGNLT